jgi:hypothetical protein
MCVCNVRVSDTTGPRTAAAFFCSIFFASWRLADLINAGGALFTTSLISRDIGIAEDSSSTDSERHGDGDLFSTAWAAIDGPDIIV